MENPEEGELTVVERCSNCGGRISANRTDAGVLAFVCMGTPGEEISCGWEAIRLAPALKKTA